MDFFKKHEISRHTRPFNERDFNSRIPRYNDSSDYTTNAPSYYDDLARKNQLLKTLSLRIWEYQEVINKQFNEWDDEIRQRFIEWDKNLEEFDDEVLRLLQEWMEDGTLDHIINETIFSWKADKTYVDSELNKVNTELDKVNNSLEQITLNVQDLGAVGDGVTDDTQAIKNALKTNGLSKLYFPKGSYLITESIYHELLNDIELIGDNAELIFNLNTHSQYGINLDLKKGVDVKISGFIMNGMKTVNTVCLITHESLSMNNVTDVYISNSTFKNVRRQKIFLGGDCLTVRGGFNLVHFYKIKVFESELPEGQGISGSQGVTGVTTTSFSENAYVKNVIFENSSVEKIYSSDSTYTADQDGLRCLSPSTVRSSVYVKDSFFKDCYGRFIKTQSTITNIKESTFNNTHPSSDGVVEAQYGAGAIENCNFIYNNGRDDLSCITVGSTLNIKNSPSFLVDNINVYLNNNSKLSTFFDTYPRTGVMGTQNIKDVNIYGTVKVFVLYRLNGSINNMNVDNCYIENIEQLNDRDLSLIQVQSSGNISPFEANVNVSNIFYKGNNTPLVMLDNIPGAGATGNLSSQNLIGFNDLKDYSGLRSSIIKSEDGQSYNQIIYKRLDNDETFIFDVKTLYGALITLTSNINKNGYAQFYTLNGTVQEINTGLNIGLGTDGIEPNDGLSKIWSPEPNKISLKNTSGARRNYGLFIQGTL